MPSSILHSTLARSFATVAASALVFAACGAENSGTPPGGDGDGGPSEGGSSGSSGFVPGDGSTGPCTGLACAQVKCDGGTPTTVTGKVYDPAGKTPLYNAIVYFAEKPEQIAPFTEGASCERCGTVTGSPFLQTLTDATGSFRIENAPVGAQKLVVQIGKWRRVVDVNVNACADNALTPEQTRLPKNRQEGSIPRIALATGAEDPLECLLTKIGVDRAEFGVSGGEERVHLYQGGGYSNLTATASFQGGAAFPVAKDALWNDVATLKKYDLVLLGCEGQYNLDQKPEASRAALYDYLKAGGRAFASHYHVTWFADGPEDVKNTADYPLAPPAPPPSPFDADIDTTFPKGKALSDWLGSQSALAAGGKLSLTKSRHDVNAVKATAQQWISLANPNAANERAVQYLTFNAPTTAPEDQQCGRAVFSDLHVSASDADKSGQPFPAGCTGTELSPQEKALIFMLFDLSSCVQSDKREPVVPR